MCGLDPSRLHRHDRFQDNNKPHLVNILKAGVVYSNKVIVMSSIHSKDQIISTLSHGLESSLGTHQNKLLISPFGYDDLKWDPSRDKFLPKTYSADDMRGKAVSKLALQQQLGLPGDVSFVLVGCIISDDSDVDLENLKSLASDSSRKGVQFIFLGSSNTSHMNSEMESFQEGLKVRAIKYGAVPVPLNVVDNNLRHFDSQSQSQSSRLSEYMINTFGNVPLSQAVDEIKKQQPSEWNRKIRDAMSKDVSWEAECYDVHVSAYMSLNKL